MLWVGWFGFNAGSELAADGTAGMAMAVTQIATAAAALGLDVHVNGWRPRETQRTGYCFRSCGRDWSPSLPPQEP